MAYLTVTNPADLGVAALDGSEDRTLVRRLDAGDPGVRPAWSADGHWLTYNQAGLFTPHNLFLIDARTGEARQVTRFTRSSEGIDRQVWLPDGRHVAVARW